MAVEELLGAPELIEGLISNVKLVVTLVQATGLVVLGWLGFSIARWWTTKKEFSEIKAIHKDLNKIKKKLKIE